jgi:hypothetical protein
LFRFTIYALPLVLVLFALFGLVVDVGAFGPQRALPLPWALLLGTWLLEASGLVALYLLLQGRFSWWVLDGLVTGWIAWIFRGPLLVITVVSAVPGQPQQAWWQLVLAWWVLYSLAGLSLAWLARRSAQFRAVPSAATAPATEPMAVPVIRGPVIREVLGEVADLDPATATATATTTTTTTAMEPEQPHRE